ncbi:MAG: shikimate dehydrogenase [Candidatus Thiodiazotropha endolucinida]|nr:shikimate dehydrogenase [Candidatus Thiodiazotropha taylori]MCG8121507.1 shikimate dehydrogenase [Candidatus Thiodiazotropha taylori]MCW4289541.1 shikimate dehydrogenase [Candidatus Thiodiazotropha endolucinida]MCW4297201.1 shikimate dehydrogenase [Candidatus Thiodiazotropha endolucinida]
MSKIRTIPTMCWSVAANPSPLGVKMHNAGYSAAGVDFTYIATGADDISDVIKLVRKAGVRGLGVSMPHKQSVIHELDEISEAVESIGACNTVVNTDGHLVGHNTDWIGAWRAIEEAGLSNVRSAVVVCSGGVARAIIYALRKNNIDVAIVARNEEVASGLANEFGVNYVGRPEKDATYNGELVINATPVNEVEEWPLRLNQFENARGFFDVFFGKLTPPLCADAKERGWIGVPGWRMLLLQGVGQFELYTGTTCPVQAMADVLEAALAGN